VFWVATGLIAVETTLFTLVVPALPVFAERYSLSDSEAALIFAAFPVAQLAGAFGSARPVERHGRRPAILLAGVLLLLATLAFALVSDPLPLAAARAIQGVAAGLAWTAGIAAISDVYPNEELGFRIGLAETAGGGAGLLGPLIGGILISSIGTGPTFALACALPATLLAVSLAAPETAGAARPPPKLGDALRRLARQPAARAGAAALAGTAAVFALLEPLLPLDLVARHDSSPAQVGFVFGAGLLAFFLTAPLAGRWSDRHGRRPPFLVGGALALTMPLTAVGSPLVVALAFATVGAALAIMASPCGPLLTGAVDDAGMAGMYGLSAAVLTIIFAAGYSIGPLAGAAASAVAPFWAITSVAAVALAAVALAAYRLLDPERHGA
jgi:MFS family permease